MNGLILNNISFGKYGNSFLFYSYVSRLFSFALLFIRVITLLIIRSFFFRTLTDNRKDSSIEKIKRLFHKNSTGIADLQGNKKQPTKQGNLGGKESDQKKYIKGQDLPENRKESAQQPKLPGKGLRHRKPYKGQEFQGNKKESAQQRNFPGKGLGHKNAPKDQDLQGNKKKSAEQAKFPGKWLGDKNSPKGQDWQEKKKESPRQPNFLEKGLGYRKPAKGPDWQENKKESGQHPNFPGKGLGYRKPPKGQDLQENQNESAKQGNFTGKGVGHKKSPQGQNLQENKKESAQQPNFSGKGLGDKNSPKGQNLQKNQKPVADPSSLVVKFTNLLMLDGKKTKALSTLSKSLKLFKKYVENLPSDDQIKQNLVNTKNKKSTLDYLHQAVLNVKPSLEVRKKKISGIMRQIPAIPSSSRKETLAIRWIIEFARKRKNKNSKPFHQCLAEELLDAFQIQGEPYKRKQTLHKTAEGNRTYIRHRWW